MKCKKCSEELNNSSIICPKCGYNNENIDGLKMSIVSNVILGVLFLPIAYMTFDYFILNPVHSNSADGFGFLFFGSMFFNTIPIIIGLILGVLSIIKYYKVKNVKSLKRKISNICNIVFIIIFFIFYLWMNGFFS